MMDTLSFVLKNFSLFYEFDDSIISYGPNATSQLRIKQSCDPDFFSHSSDINPNQVLWKEWAGKKIPFLFETEIEDMITVYDSHVCINVDIIAASFYFLSGWNEYVTKKRDNLGRFPYADSIIQELGIIQLPVVNYYFDILQSALSEISKVKKKAVWDNHDFATFLTHDIDTLNKGWKAGIVKAVRSFKPLDVLKIFIQMMRSQDGFFTFGKITELEKRYGANSSYFFLRKKKDNGAILNSDYRVSSPRMIRVIKDLLANGNEVAVHGSYLSHLRKDVLEKDIESIPGEVVGNRFHYLLYDPQDTVSVLQNSGLKYDSSVGFAERSGFRRATCYPFYLFDFQTMQASELIEFPLIAMDATFIAKQYMELGLDEVMDYLLPILEEIERFGGLFTVLWHNNYFDDYVYPGWTEMYEEICNHCKNSNSSFPTGKELLSSLLDS